MNRKEFVKLLAKRFYPILRKEDFKGSGTLLRRIDEPLLHVFAVQANNENDGVWINLGAGLGFLNPPIPNDKRHDYHCTFRHRMLPPAEYGNDAWPFGDDEAGAHAVIDDIEAAWAEDGHDFFRKFATYPDSFRRVLRETDFSELSPNDALTYAEIATEIGDRAIASQIAQDTIGGLGDENRHLIRLFKQFLTESG